MLSLNPSREHQDEQTEKEVFDEWNTTHTASFASCDMDKRQRLGAELDRDMSRNLLLASYDAITQTEPAAATTRSASSPARFFPHHGHLRFSNCPAGFSHPRSGHM